MKRDTSQAKQEEKIVLTDDEMKIYGKRFPSDYYKGPPLGKGGQGIVFKGTDDNNITYAVKQIPISECPLNSAMKEIELVNTLFHGDAIDEMDEDGRECLMRMVDSKVTAKDLFIVMPLGGVSCSKMVYTFKGEFFKSERIYSITNGLLYYKLHDDCFFLQEFVKKIILGISSLSTREIVHCDLKLENI